VADSEGEPEHPKPGWRQRWKRRLALAGTALLVVGLLGAATTFGWMLRGWVPSGGVGVRHVVVQRPIEVEANAPSGTLPNVLGLSVGQARQAYADAGVEPTTIKATQTPYFAQPGTVIEQRPGAATALSKSAGRVELLVAQPARMPPLIGVAGDDARARLEKIGVGATTVVRYEASVDPGAVARTRPQAGSPVGARATLVVSEAPSSVNLDDLTAERNDCNLADSTLTCDVDSDGSTVEYAINDRVTGFEATLALADDAPAGARASLVVRSGGRVLATYPATGTPREIRVKVPGGGTRLTLELRHGGGDENVGVVLTGPRIVGARSGIDALVKGKTP
jgi:hypothetical protein